MPVDRKQLLGREFDFAFGDEDGHVALFSTAGYGPVPKAALMAKGVEALPEPEQVMLANLSEIGSVQSEGRGPGQCAEWPALGRRGVYVYDWRPHSGPYERIIVPEIATTSNAVGSCVVSLLAGVMSGCFGRRSAVQPRELGAKLRRCSGLRPAACYYCFTFQGVGPKPLSWERWAAWSNDSGRIRGCRVTGAYSRPSSHLRGPS
jgi:hypothetical protein